MNERWFEWFAAVCGQNPDHTWMPGGVSLPFCQRCTGLYVGILAAVGLHLVLRPRLTGRFLWAHGGLFLVMAPFGFHWVAHGPWVRSITGVLFGFGVATFLWTGVAPTGKGLPAPLPLAASRYALLLAGVAVATPMLGAWGGAGTAAWLTGLAGMGLLALAGLLVANAWAGAGALVRLIQSHRFLPGRLRVHEPHGRLRCPGFSRLGPVSPKGGAPPSRLAGASRPGLQTPTAPPAQGHSS